MHEEGLIVIRPSKTKKYCSYKGELTDAPKDLIKHNFSAKRPDEIWLTDMTEFALPSNKKIYLNPIIDVFDGAPVSWRIGPRPTKALSEGSLKDAIQKCVPILNLSSILIVGFTTEPLPGSPFATRQVLPVRCHVKGVVRTTRHVRDSSDVSKLSSFMEETGLV